MCIIPFPLLGTQRRRWRSRKNRAAYLLIINVLADQLFLYQCQTDQVQLGWRGVCTITIYWTLDRDRASCVESCSSDVFFLLLDRRKNAPLVIVSHPCRWPMSKQTFKWTRNQSALPSTNLSVSICFYSIRFKRKHLFTNRDWSWSCLNVLEDIGKGDEIISRTRVVVMVTWFHILFLSWQPTSIWLLDDWLLPSETWLPCASSKAHFPEFHL